jgi:hypothetical protein
MWEDWYRDLLCELIKRWGRSCDTLDKDPDQRTEQVVNVYRAEGVPVFGSPDERNKFLDLLDSLENGLSSPENSLSEASNGLIATYIADLRAELVTSA